MHNHLSRDDRSTIGELLRQNLSQRQIAEEIGVSVSTISRELRRDGLRTYCPEVAHHRAVVRRRVASSQPRKLDEKVLREFFKLMERYRSVHSAAHFLPVGKSALYNWLWRDGCEGSHMKPHRPRKKKRLSAPHCWMQHGVGKYGRRPKDGRFAMMKDAASIASRPEIVDAEGRIGDWEADTMFWSGNRMSLTLLERKSGYVRLMLMPEKSAVSVAAHIVKKLRGLPAHTITSDGGWEFSQWLRVEKTGAKWYVCDAGRPQQRGKVEQKNGSVRRLVEQDIGRYGLAGALRRTEWILNHRPTARLQNRTPAQQLQMC